MEQEDDRHLVCPRCNCADLRAYRTIQLAARVLRYRVCRHCGHKILTRQNPETIVRNVRQDSNTGI
jgi:DNA-directed RNA polymerase subunit RPC12/RpoP